MTERINAVRRWGLLWRSQSKLGGLTRHIMCEDQKPLLFLTRAEARLYARKTYGYIRSRPDLRNEPHGWQMPLAVRVKVAVEAAE